MSDHLITVWKSVYGALEAENKKLQAEIDRLENQCDMDDNAISELHLFFDLPKKRTKGGRHIIDAVCMAGNKYKKLLADNVELTRNNKIHVDHITALRSLIGGGQKRVRESLNYVKPGGYCENIYRCHAAEWLERSRQKVQKETDGTP